MDRSVIETLARRIQALEDANNTLQRACRRWKRAGAGALAGAIVLVGAGAKFAGELQTVEAGHFVLRDESGRMRAALGLRADGTPGLGLFDENGKVRLSFDLQPNGAPGVNLYDQESSPQAALAIRADGTPGLGLFDENGKVRLSLDLGSHGTPGVNVYDEASTLRAALAVRPDGSPGLGLFDDRGRISFSLDGEVGAEEFPAGDANPPVPGGFH